MSHKFGGLDPTEKARIGATLIRCRVLAAKIATAWRGCNNARCYKTRLWNTRVTAGNADGARVSALCNKNRPLGNGGTVTARQAGQGSPAGGVLRCLCNMERVTENEPHPRPAHDCARGARGPASTADQH